MGGNDPLPPITSMGDEVKQDGGNNGKGGRRGNDGRWRKEGRKEIKTRVSRDDNNVGLLIFAVLRQNLSEGRQAGRTLTEVEEERRVKNDRKAEKGEKGREGGRSYRQEVCWYGSGGERVGRCGGAFDGHFESGFVNDFHWT
jgi:hypothetical protein